MFGTCQVEVCSERATLLIIFPCLTALCVKFLFNYPVILALYAQCSPSESSNPQYLLSYTGLDPIDNQLCVLVGFFQTIMASSTPASFLTYFLGTAGPLAHRTGQSRLLAFPFIWSLLSQTLSIGLISTIYCFAFLLFGGAAKGHKTDAEAIVFGIITGAVIPTVSMLVLKDPYVTAIWVLYPVYVSIAHFIHLQFRPASRYSQPGFRTIQALFIGCFIISSSVHISIVWPMINDHDTLRAFFLPSVAGLEYSTDLTLQIFDLWKWDFIFSFISVAIASLWFASNMTQFVAIIAWYIGAIPTVGFGAAITGVAIWRGNILGTS
ncbi:hypothetical protein BYT27DRAFT_7236811 [Phlegmacium glaucopus]|nr:hypothetical protein BYT27DRAFT_7236811 [Phlegmacium glaucopus]